jgi:plastocyanin
MNKKVLIGVIAVAGIVLLGAWAYIMAQPNANNGNTTTTTPSTSQESTPSSDTSTPTEVPAATTAAATITYTDEGFTPNKVTIKKGEVITVTNSSTRNLQFSSADHPTHRLDPELNMNVLKPGESGNITVSTVGTHGYHDHLDASMTGSIEVTE